MGELDKSYSRTGTGCLWQNDVMPQNRRSMFDLEGVDPMTPRTRCSVASRADNDRAVSLQRSLVNLDPLGWRAEHFDSAFRQADFGRLRHWFYFRGFFTVQRGRNTWTGIIGKCMTGSVRFSWVKRYFPWVISLTGTGHVQP